MSLSSAFRAVGNDPGIITWRIEVSGTGAHLPPGHPGLILDSPSVSDQKQERQHLSAHFPLTPPGCSKQVGSRWRKCS